MSSLIPPLFFILLVTTLLLHETTCCDYDSNRKQQQKVKEFQEKLEKLSDSSTSPFPQSSQPKQIGRVFYPIGYGADPSGAEESSEALMAAINDAFQVQNGTQLLPGVNDLGGILIDLQGGKYNLSRPLRFSASGGGNLLITGGTLRASSSFPVDRHLIELWSPNSRVLGKTESNRISPLFDRKDQSVGIYYEDITFRDILFDSGYRGGGLFIIDSARIRVDHCFFLHFRTEGILVQRGHETFISSCFLGQHSTVGGDPGEKDFSGTAIDLASNDNAITDVAIFSSEIGVLLRGQANIITGVHCYNKATYWGGIGILVKRNAGLTRIDNCYMDFNSIVMEDPFLVHVTNGLFLGDGNVVVKSVEGKINGVNIVNNMFNGNPKNMIPTVKLEGNFTGIDQVLIDQNNVNGMSLKSTTGKLSVAENGTKWVADFSGLLVFPNKINHFQYSFFVQGKTSAGFPVHAVTSVTNNVVVVESDKPVNAVVSVAVDQHGKVEE